MQATAQREKRRLLDAQRGKCRVRLGSHLDEWCALKDHLGFAQHAQLAKFLLDSYISTTSPDGYVPKAIAFLSVSLSSLKHLAFLCHQHGRDCPTTPTILPPSHSCEDLEMPVLLWGCKEHRFSWNPRDCIKDKEANFGLGEKTPDATESLSDETDPQEKDSESVCTLGSQRGEEHDQCGSRTYSQGGDTEPTSVVSLSESDTTFDRSEENIVEPLLQYNGENRIEELVESTADDRQQLTTSNEEEPKTTDESQQQIPEIGVKVFQLEQTTLPAPTIEDRERTHSEGLKSVTQDPSVLEVADNCSINSSKKETPETPSVWSTRRQRTGVQQPQSYHRATADEPEAALLVVCRRSPRSSKQSQKKTDSKEQVSYSRARCRLTYKAPTQKQELTGDITPEAETNEEICPIEESIVEEVIGPNVSAEDLDSLDTTEEQQMLEAEQSPLSESIWKADDGSLPVQVPEREPPPVESGDQKGNQCRIHKVSRLKPGLDEELAQICKKRIRQATPPELLMCEYENCGKIFSKRQYLNYHQKYQHMNQRTFRCSVPDCGKTFNFKKHLKEHEKRHSDRRDFICEFCARAFRSSSNLIIHRRIHTGEKPLQCEFCGFTCRQKASLNWHMKKHDAASSYLYPCDICGQRFEKKDNLAAHKSRKHPEPRQGAPQPSFEGDASSAEYSGQTECQETLTELTAVSQDSIKETVFPEYLDLTESVQEAQVTTQAEGSTEMSMVIVL
ncbi:PREDICTED: zinc finger protein 692-like [Nanorana parkeri]|uniref:zinc finger protein 692-like n=1 Tax=Nanorana parkeri TaxID=125878 RepID=UPI000853F93B|nr:PREDICTED: zinc finger protein 692-like [Nanorana parkeri]